MEHKHGWFDSAFMPHGHCYFWQPGVLWPNVIGDVLTFLAYFSIPVLLVMFLKQRKDIQFRLIFFAFAAFILACGTTHLLAAISVWYPLYYVEGYTKLGTAAISLFTVGLLISNFPQILSLPTVAQWQKKNQELLQEIEERKEKESLLRASEGKFSFIMKNAPVGMALLDLKGNWTEVNHTIIKMLRYSEEELLKLDFQSITHPEDLGGDMELMEKLLNGHTDNAEFEKRYIKKGGGLLYGLVNVQIIRDAGGNNQFFIIQIVDITHRKEEEQLIIRSKKKLEREVEARTRELREANQDMEHFIYAISHDLRMPLNTREEEIRIDISGKYEEEMTVYRISDNGVGFEEKYANKLFTLFQRLHTYEEFKGSGAGLAICERIIKKHGGAMWASSKSGEGATFYFSIPAE